nr:GPI-linked NAD(P)(+)--arginine ADP-ribosyltransferase 1-like [Anolis sagrei ordinatus]
MAVQQHKVSVHSERCACGLSEEPGFHRSAPEGLNGVNNGDISSSDVSGAPSDGTLHRRDKPGTRRFKTGREAMVLCLKTVPLNMAPNSFDDQYNDCDPEMEKTLMDPTQSDFASQQEFVNIWKRSLSRWKQVQGSPNVPRNFGESCGVAIAAYTDGGPLYKRFNEAVREGGKSTDQYRHSFPFKSFHFLLTKAHQALKASCRIVYRGVRNLRFNVSDPRKPIRFGQFASSSLKKEVAEGYGKDTFFTIQTCLGVDISHFSFHPYQEEVLIPPYEVFRVMSIREKGAHIELKANGKHSNFNCGLKSGKSWGMWWMGKARQMILP